MKVNYSAISRFESGRRFPSPKNLQKLLDFFGVKSFIYLKPSERFEIQVTCKCCLRKQKIKVREYSEIL